MNKRTFLKLVSGALTAPALRRLSAWEPVQRLTNWAGNFQYSTGRVLEARDTAQVQRIVRSEKRLRALGTRHCFNRIADSADGLVTLKPADLAVSLDRNARTATVSGGITYGRLCPYLDSQGYALHNLASLPHISIAGACSTGTHGSGEKNGNLSTAVSALEIVTAAGEVMKLSRAVDAETFHGAVVGLGALGVITQVMLDIQPAFVMRQYVYQDMPFDQMRDHFDAIQASAYSVSLFTDWQRHRVNEVWIKSRAEDHFAGTPEFFGAKRATRNLHPIAELSAENCTGQLGVPGPWYDRLPHFRMGFTPSAGKELQSEYFVPRQHAVEAILAIERLRDRIGPHLMISEIRAIAADQLWLSPCYRRPSVTLHFTWKQDWPAVRQLLPVIERELGPFQPRPHWGKLFTLAPAQLRAAYERMPDFIRLCNRVDPQGKFRNEFLNTNVFEA